jgi:hypothetical protein
MKGDTVPAELDHDDLRLQDEVSPLRDALRAQSQELRLSRLIQAESRRDAEVSREELVETRRHRDQVLGELAVARAQLAGAAPEGGSSELAVVRAELAQLREQVRAAEFRRAEIEAWTPVRVAFRIQAFLLRHLLMRRVALRIARIIVPPRKP